VGRDHRCGHQFGSERRREQALERARRALAEFEAKGMATVIPFHRAVIEDLAFTSAPFSIHTRWIETEFNNTIPPFAGDVETDDAEEPSRETVVVEVGGKRLEARSRSNLRTAATRCYAAAPSPSTVRRAQRWSPTGGAWSFRAARSSAPGDSRDLRHHTRGDASCVPACPVQCIRPRPGGSSPVSRRRSAGVNVGLADSRCKIVQLMPQRQDL
jgi:hypothetical protein